MRSLSSWLVALLAVSTLHCASDAEDGDGDAEDDLTGAQAARIAKGSAEERAIINLTNDLSLDANAYVTQVKLAKGVATSLVSARSGSSTGPEDDKVFRTIEEVDKLPNTGSATFTALRNFAIANKYDLARPNLALLEIPDGLGRPPTSNDVKVYRGFDGRKPDEALAQVRAKLTNAVDSSNERFFRDTVLASHKSFTIGLGNFFAPGSPTQVFLRQFDSTVTFTLFATMSALRPTVLRVQVPHGATYYFQKASPGAGAAYEVLDASVKNADGTPRYPVIMSSTVRLSPGGVYVEYPKWGATVLASPITGP